MSFESAPTQPRILVTGGAGFVGTQLCRHLASAGFRVRALDLPGPRLDALSDRAEIVPGNLLEPGALEAALRDCDAVVHLVVAHEHQDREAHERLTMGGLRRLIEACGAVGVDRVVFMSSIKAARAYDGLYGAYKRRAEELLHASTLRWTILRPGLLYGPGELRLSRIAAFLRKWPVFPLPGGGRYPIHPVRTEDLARAVAAALRRDASIGRTYELGTDAPVPLRRIVEMVGERIGRRRPFLSLPLLPCRWIGSFLQAVSRHPVLFAEQIKAMQCEVPLPDTTPAKRDLDFSTPDFAEGLDELVATWGEPRR